MKSPEYLRHKNHWRFVKESYIYGVVLVQERGHMPYRQHSWMGGVSQDVMKNPNARCGATRFDICPSGFNSSLGTIFPMPPFFLFGM